MKQAKLLFLLIATLAFVSCRLTKQIDGRTLSDDFYIPSNITFPTPVYR